MSARYLQADAALKIAVLCGLIGCSCLASAEDDEQPDMEFLEYLGSWEESDEDWLLLNEMVKEVANEKERSDPVPDGKESTELQNES